MTAPQPATERIVAEEKAQLDFSQSMSNGDYPHLDEVLQVQHHTGVLWMKQMLHELRATIAAIAKPSSGFKRGTDGTGRELPAQDARRRARPRNLVCPDHTL